MGTKFNADSRATTRCYLINLDTKEKLITQFNPTSIPYGRSANYSEISSPGMSYPLTQYSGGNAREFSVELFYYDNPYSGKIDKARKFLENLLPPEENKNAFVRPPAFTFAYGYFVKTLVLLDLQITDDWLDSDGHPLMTTFTLSVRQVGV